MNEAVTSVFYLGNKVIFRLMDVLVLLTMEQWKPQAIKDVLEGTKVIRSVLANFWRKESNVIFKLSNKFNKFFLFIEIVCA